MHTPIEFYVILPVDLFRAGTPTKHKFDYLRTRPPRGENEVYDVKVDPNTRIIDHTSGGLSLFSTPNFSFGADWWIVPAGTKLPPEFTLTKDSTGGSFKGHYTIRTLINMHEDIWKRKLREWADENVVHISRSRKARGHV